MSRQANDDPLVIPGRLTRRRALAGAATVGLSSPLLTACADESASRAGPTRSASPGPQAEPGTEPTEDSTAEPIGSGGEVLSAVVKIPIGGGVVFTDSRVVVTQPTAGDLRCFSAVCPHQGCLVAGVTSMIICTCHNSSFDISTGEVLGGPAPAPLSLVDFTINKNQVVLS